MYDLWVGGNLCRPTDRRYWWWEITQGIQVCRRTQNIWRAGEAYVFKRAELHDVLKKRSKLTCGTDDMYTVPDRRVFLPFACVDNIWGCDLLALGLTSTRMRDQHDV